MNGPADRTIKPGDTHQVVITLSSKNRYKEFTRKINVYTNDEKHRHETLVCVGKVMLPMTTAPKHAQFGQIKRDAGPQTRTLTITEGDGGPIMPSLLPIREKGVQASLSEIEAGKRYELEVTIGEPWPSGRVRSKLMLKTGVDKAPTMQIPLYAYVVPRLRAKPERVSIPRQADKQVRKSVQLVWDNGPPGRALEVSVDDPDLTVTLEDRNKIQVVMVVVPSGYSTKARRRTITIKTDDEQVPTLRVPVTYQRIRKPPRQPQAAGKPGAKPKPPAGKKPSEARPKTSSKAGQ